MSDTLDKMKKEMSPAAKLQLIIDLMNVPESYDEYGNPIGEITSLLSPAEARKLLGFDEGEK